VPFQPRTVAHACLTVILFLISSPVHSCSHSLVLCSRGSSYCTVRPASKEADKSPGACHFVVTFFRILAVSVPFNKYCGEEASPRMPRKTAFSQMAHECVRSLFRRNGYALIFFFGGTERKLVSLDLLSRE
jgi:hypothetical protein